MNNISTSTAPVSKRHPIYNTTPEITPVLLSRFFRELRENLNQYKSSGGSFQNLRDQTLAVMHELGDDIISPIIPLEEISNESRQVALKIRSLLTSELLQQEDPEAIENFFLNNNVHLKMALGQRLYATPGVNLEPIHVDKDLPSTLLNWLSEKFQVQAGDIVLHRHVHGEAMQNRLHSAGILPPYKGWLYKDYAWALDVSAELMVFNSGIKGIISEGSWIYDPSAHDMAPDGKPYLASRFLKYDELTGHRIQLPQSEIGELYEIQQMFASKHPRRKAFIEQGAWTPKVYGTFYPKDELFRYLRQFSL